MKKIGKIVLWVVIGLLVLDITVVGLLFVPSIQTFVVNKITHSLSENWGTEISIQNVRITPTLKIVAHEVKIDDHHHNGMITAETLKARLLSFSIKPLKLRFGALQLDDADVVLRTYQGEDRVNIAIWAKMIQKKEKEEKGTFLLTARNFQLTDSRFVLINDNKRVVFDTENQPDIDYGFLELDDLEIDADDLIVDANDIVKIGMKFNQLAANQYGGFSLEKGQADFYICDTALVLDGMHFVTPNSDLNMDLAFHYDDWSQLGDFVDSVRIIATIRPTTISMKDVSGWAPALKGMEERFALTADRFNGTVNDFKLINFLVKWGLNTRLHGDLAIKDVTDFKHADITLNLDSSNVMVPELAYFTLPKGKTLPINKTLSRFGNTKIKCFFAGELSEYNVRLDAVSGLGTIYANLGTLIHNGQLHLKGSVSSPNFNLAKLIGKGKILNKADLFVSVDGNMAGATLDLKNFKTLTAHLKGDIGHLGLYGYPLSNTSFEGDYADRLYNGTFTFADPNFDCNILAQLDITEKLPALQGNITLEHLNASKIADKMHAVDSAEAKGFDKLIYAVKQNPNLKFSFDNFMVALRGNNLENVNGYIGCDNIHIVSNEDSTENDRLRLTIMNSENNHKYILSSGIANATLESTYSIKEIKNTLQAFAHNYFPTLVQPAPKHTMQTVETKKAGFIKVNMTAYRTRNITKLLFPDFFIASNSTIDIVVSSDHETDKIEANLPFFGIRNKLSVRNLIIDGNTKGNDYIQLGLTADSAMVMVGKNALNLDAINLAARAQNDSILYKLNWQDNLNRQDSLRSQLAGFADVSNANDLIISLKNSNLYINDVNWQFNNQNAIHFQKDTIVVDSLKFFHGNSSIDVNGAYAKNSDKRLMVSVNSVDMAIVNSLLRGMEVDGDISADITLICPKKKAVIFGKALIDEFAFNQAPLGDVFAMAGLDTTGNVKFAGGIFPLPTANAKSELADFSYATLQNTDNLIARLDGVFTTEKRDLAIHAKFDTLNAGFVSRFLSGFSDQFTGIASGNLSFYANPDSTYFDGLVNAIDINMGIAPLGTVYNIKNQDILFNSKGIFFDKINISDNEGNTAQMSGGIRHKFFKDMKIDLSINTDRLMVLNTPKDPTSVFYGEGFVAGDVSIKGVGSTIAFQGPNLRTLSGSRIVLQVTSANSTTQSNVIQFTPKKTASKKSSTEEVLPTTDDRTSLNFDFTFNVTNDADIVLYLESIGGTMNARADGKFQLVYNDNDNLNLYGNLGIHSGDFRISLFNVVNSKFLLVPGGGIHFDGPLDNMTANISAYKSSKTSLAEIVPSESIGNSVNVNAYLHLNGPLMQRIEPTFSFELPNSSAEVRNMFYTAIDTTNKENMTKQFAYFMVTNNFMPNSMFSSDRNGGGIGASGMNMFRNIVNNMLGSLISSKNGSFGITYNQATETTSAEYGVTGSANLLKDRVTVETSIGYYDDQNSQGINNMYGDFSVAYSINKAGTWKLKAYTYLGERDENYFLHSDQLNYTAGVAIAYKQDFNTIHRKKEKTTKKIKKNKKAHEKQ